MFTKQYWEAVAEQFSGQLHHEDGCNDMVRHLAGCFAAKELADA